jgi:YD repeat-containing protein
MSFLAPAIWVESGEAVVNRRLALFAAIVVVGATLVPAVPAFATSGVSLTVNSIGRSVSSGYLAYDVNVEGTGYNTSYDVCDAGSHVCNGGLQAQLASDNSWVNVSWDDYFWQHVAPYSTHLSNVYLQIPEIKAVRAFLSGTAGTIYSAAQSVSDFDPAQTVSMTVNSVGRDSQTGNLRYDVSVSASYYELYGGGDVCTYAYTSSQCLAFIDVQYTDGTTGYINYSYDFFLPASYPHTQDFTGSINISRVSAIRARIAGLNGDLSTDWIKITDFVAGETRGGFNAAEKNCACSHGDPVNTGTGEFYLPSTDDTIAGAGPTLSVARTYSSSLAAQDGPFGYGWSTNFTSQLEVLTPGDLSDPLPRVVNVVQENGAVVQFREKSDQTYEAPDRVEASLVYDDGSETWTFTRKQTEVLTFNSDGDLTSFQDLHGNSVEVGYSSGHVTSLSGAGGRSINLTWSLGHVTALSDSAGRAVSYAYDGYGNLQSLHDVGHEARWGCNDQRVRLLSPNRVANRSARSGDDFRLQRAEHDHDGVGWFRDGRGLLGGPGRIANEGCGNCCGGDYDFHLRQRWKRHIQHGPAQQHDDLHLRRSRQRPHEDRRSVADNDVDIQRLERGHLRH